MTAEVDGSALTPDEFGSFMILLIGAGIDTTRTSLSWAVNLLSRHPEQRTALLADLPGRLPGAIEEVVRWAGPVVHMRRTATRDTVLGGRDIAQGDKVVMWYLSANHDENVFAEADRFDITRPDIADHVGFGAGGPNFCQSGPRRNPNNAPDAVHELHATAEPELLVSPFINGIKTLPCTVR